LNYEVIVVGAGPGACMVMRNRFYAFASAPAEGLEPFYANLIERLVHRSLHWRFLTQEERPYHDCPHSSIATFAQGLSTVVVLRKCCTVAAPVLPCLESPEVAV
jgi:hypothetical protein